MTLKNENAHRIVRTPTIWPDPPAEMSVSTYAEIDGCPRRWALSAAEYPDIWSGRGYPPKLQVAALAGSVVHLALEIITKQLTRAGVPSLDDPLATQALRQLGGYTKVVEDCVGRMLKRFEGNPRALPVMEHAQRTLRGQVPVLRARVQSMLARLRLRKGAPPAPATPAPKTARPPGRRPLSNGTSPEVELRAKSIGWKGITDLLVLGDDACEITDFKTGATDEAHKFQVRVYAALWRLDEELNPSGRIVDRLVLAYESQNVEVAPPSAQELDDLGRHLLVRRRASETALAARPPVARPGADTCRYCGVPGPRWRSPTTVALRTSSLSWSLGTVRRVGTQSSCVRGNCLRRRPRCCGSSNPTSSSRAREFACSARRFRGTQRMPLCQP